MNSELQSALERARNSLDTLSGAIDGLQDAVVGVLNALNGLDAQIKAAPAQEAKAAPAQEAGKAASLDDVRSLLSGLIAKGGEAVRSRILGYLSGHGVDRLSALAPADLQALYKEAPSWAPQSTAS